MITAEEAARIMAIVQYPSFDGTTWAGDVVGRLDEAWGGKSHYFGGPAPFWYTASLRATREMHAVAGIVRMIAAIRGAALDQERRRRKLSPVWFKENK